MPEVDEKTFDRMFTVDVASIHHTVRSVVPLMRQRLIATIQFGRLRRASGVAAAALYRASDAVASINGVELPIDGGRAV